MVELQQDNAKYKKHNELLAAQLTEPPENPPGHVSNDTGNESENTATGDGQDNLQVDDKSDKQEDDDEGDSLQSETTGDLAQTHGNGTTTPSNVQGHVEVQMQVKI